MRRRSTVWARLAAVVAALLLAVSYAVVPVSTATATPAPCASPTGSKPPVGPTTITTLQQAYWCLLDHYYSGPVLDDRVLLTAAFAGLTQELIRRDEDRPDATMPALTGDPGYQPGDVYGLGIETSPRSELATQAPQLAVQTALPPLFVSSVDPGSPAATTGTGLRPGDVIVSVDRARPFADGVVATGALNLLAPQYPQHRRVRLTVRRPATDRTWTVTLTPRLYRGSPPAVSAKLLRGDVAYVQLPGFDPDLVQQALTDITKLRAGRTLRGVIVDVRGNGGGSPVAVAKLLGAFAHGKAYGYECDVHDTCTATYTDDTTPLLHLPLVELTDRNCFSACEAFSAGVKDLHLGTLVGTRTGGAVAGPATGMLLNDGSTLVFPAKHGLGADREVINGIGVATDYNTPRTATDLSTGHDPAVAKALQLLAP